MIYKFNDFLFEKSSLTQLGVPNNVMKTIQEDFALAPDVEWVKMNLKSDILNELKKGEKNLYIMISIKDINVFVSHQTIKGIEYFIDKYVYQDGDWGGTFEKLDREYKTFTQLSYDIDSKSNIYKINGEFSVKEQSIRQLDKQQKDNTEFVEKFKKDFIKNFDSILKRITNKNFNSAKEEIKEKARMIAYQNKMIIQNLDNPLLGGNGLNILDEFLYKFEDEYTEFFGERLDVQEMADYFTRDKVLTMFMYYVYKGKTMK